MTKLEEFGKDILDILKSECTLGNFDVDLEDLLGVAEKHGLVRYTEYCPKKHKGMDDVAAEYDIEAGARIWYWGRGDGEHNEKKITRNNEALE